MSQKSVITLVDSYVWTNKYPLRFLLLLGPVIFFGFFWGRALVPTTSYLVGSIAPASELPAYHMRLSDGKSDAKRHIDTVTHLTFDDHLEILIQPDDRVRCETHAEAYLIQGGRLVPWHIDLQRASSGAFVLSEQVGAIPGLGEGAWDILIVVGRSSTARHAPLSFLTNDFGLRMLWGHLEISGRNSR